MVSPKTPVELKFAANEYNINIDDSFTAPELTVTPADAAEEVKYSSSKTMVATVDETTGAVTIVGHGETTITAAIKDSETYQNASANYTLVVTDPNATEEAFVFGQMGLSDATAYTDFNKGVVSLKFDKCNNSNPPKYYNSSSDMRLYGGGTLTISVEKGYYLKRVTSAYHNKTNALSANHGTFNSDFTTWAYDDTQKQDTVVFTEDGNTGNRSWTSIEVEYGQLTSPAPWARVSEDGLVSIEVRVDGKPVEAEIFYAVTSSNVAPEKVENIYSEPFQLNEGISYVWATACIEGYATSPITNVLMAQYDGDKAVIGLPYTKHDANELREGHWYIVVAQGNDGSYLAMGDVNAAGHHEAIKVAHNGTSIDAVDFDSKGIHEFQCVGGNLVEKNSHNHLAPAPEAQEAHALSLVEAAPTTTFANNGDSHSLTINGKTLGYDATTGTFGFTGDHTGNVMLYTTGGNVNTGIDEVTVPTDDTVEYYNLQGIRVTSPTGGLYLRRQGNRVTKVIL